MIITTQPIVAALPVESAQAPIILDKDQLEAEAKPRLEENAKAAEDPRKRRRSWQQRLLEKKEAKESRRREKEQQESAKAAEIPAIPAPTTTALGILLGMPSHLGYSIIANDEALARQV